MATSRNFLHSAWMSDCAGCMISIPVCDPRLFSLSCITNVEGPPKLEHGGKLWAGAPPTSCLAAPTKWDVSAIVGQDPWSSKSLVLPQEMAAQDTYVAYAGHWRKCMNCHDSRICVLLGMRPTAPCLGNRPVPLPVKVHGSLIVICDPPLHAVPLNAGRASGKGH